MADSETKDEAEVASPGKGPSAWRRLLSSQLVFVCTAYLLCSFMFTVIYIKVSSEIPEATTDMLTSYTANTPFQYRVLVPFVAGVLADATDLSLIAVYYALTVLIVFGILLGFRKLLSLFMPANTASACAPIILYPMLWNYGVLACWYFASDIAAILFFILGAICLRTRKWALYYPIFILAVFNRETSCFLILAYILTYYGQHKPGRLALHALAQVAIWVGVKLMLTSFFADNIGPRVFEHHPMENFAFLASVFDLELKAMERLAVFGFIWAAIPFGWRDVPPFAKRLLWIVPPYFVGMTLVARYQEPRIWSELIPILTLPAIYGLARLLGMKVPTVETPAESPTS